MIINKFIHVAANGIEKWKWLSHVRLFSTSWNSRWNSLGQNTGVGSCFLLQGIFPTQGSNPDLLHCRQILYQQSQQGSPALFHSFYRLVIFYCVYIWASLVAQMVKNLPAVQEIWVPSLGREDPLEKEMATHSSIFAWIIPWTEEPGKLQSMGSQRVS